MHTRHKLEMPDYCVTIDISENDNVTLEIDGHPDIAPDVGNAVMKLLESGAGTPIVEACRNPTDQRLQEAAKNLLRKCITIVPLEEDDAAAEQEDQME